MSLSFTSFTAQQILDLTRRQLNITTENAAYANTSANLTAQQTALLNVDSTNSVFYDFFDTSARAYESEVQVINGAQFLNYTNGTISPYVPGGLSTSAATPGAAGATLFPSGYAYFIPYPNASLGYLHQTGTAPLYEENLIVGLSTMIADLPLSGSATETTATAIPAGSVSGLTLIMSHASDFSTGDLVTLTNGSNVGVYTVTLVTGDTSITVSSVIPVTAALSGTTTVDNTSSTLNLALLTNMTLWTTYLTTEIAALTSQNDDRATQMAQKATALSNANAALTIVNSWIATPDYTNPSSALNLSVQAQITARESFLPTRVTQIATALGVTTVNENTFSGTSGDIYYERYSWLNNRINTASGSARRYFAANQGISMLGTLLTNNTMIQSDYNEYFLTKKITFIDSTSTIQVTDTAELSNGDSIMVLSESQKAIGRTIVAILGTTQLQLNSPIPNTYQTTATDLARIYKNLP